MEQSVNLPILPSISILIPTLNSSSVLEECLRSIDEQNYPKEKIEIIIADGGSQDSTLEIAEKYEAIIFNNPLKTGEAGKAVALKHARNEIIALIDSDNILPEKDWLKKMVEPFMDLEVAASEPINYTYRESDGYITRYCALLGMNDPLCLFLGNYDRFCVLTGKWTEMPVREEDKGNYLEIGLDARNLPTIGANGFLIRRTVLKKFDIGDYLFDIDIVYKLLTKNNNVAAGKDVNFLKPVKFAKVKTGIIHIFSGNIRTFIRKQRRRIRDYLYYNKLGVREYPWAGVNKKKLLKFVVSTVTLLPLIIQSIKGYFKKPDIAWFFHPLACCLTLWEYGMGWIAGAFGAGEFKRHEWKQ